MQGTWLATRYAWAVGALGGAIWIASLVIASPWISPGSLQPSLLENTAILLLLTLLSAFSPIETRGGGVLTTTLAPLFGAVALPLPPWAVMTVASLGTIDSRLPVRTVDPKASGRQIAWENFAFNRGMYILCAGVPSFLIQRLGPGVAGYVAALAAMLALNTILVAAIFSLRKGTTIIATVRAAFAGNGLTYVVLPLTGILVASLLQNQQLLDKLIVFVLYGPLLIYRTSIQKQRRLDTWLRDSFIMQSRVVDKRDGQTFGHSQRVGELCETVARLMHLGEDSCNTIRVGGILHDLGKIAIPDSILLKPSKLTPEEYEIIKTHPVEGAQILAEHPEQKQVAEIVRHHHERWDGEGYPDGLKGEHIPIGSRIVNACDAFDTITQARVFRPTVRTPVEAIKELRTLAGTWYDPAVISAMETIVAQRWGFAPAVAGRAVPVVHERYRDALGVRPFRLLWFGQAVSYFGDMMNTAGLAIMLFFLTHSASIVALGLISKAVPSILFGLVAGPLVDRYNRQQLMISADLFRGLLTVTIPFVAIRWLPGVFVAVFLVATASAFFNPAKQAIIPNLLPAKLLVKGNGLISSSEKAMEVLGYSLAGIIAAAVSYIPLFLIDAGTYLCSAISLLGVPDDAHKPTSKPLRLLDDVREGTRFIMGNVTLRATMAVTLVSAVFFAMTVTVLVVLAYRQLNAGASGYGLLEAAIGAGAVLGSFVAAELMRRRLAGTLIVLGVAGVGLANFLLGLTYNLWIAVAILLFGGILNMLYYLPTISVAQREAPDWVRGRVMSTRFLIVQGGFLVGMACAGPLSDRIGVGSVFMVGGIALIATAAVAGLFRSLRQASLREEPAPPALKATAVQ
jgi:putative nucleotidyltransferase with HDIG domain